MGRRRVDEKVVCQRDHERASHYTTLRNYDISSKRHLGFKFQINTLDSMFPTSINITKELK